MEKSIPEWKPGDRVVTAIKYITIGLGGKSGTVVDTRPPFEVPGDPDFPYRNGMVNVRLDGAPEDDEKWFPPEDLMSEHVVQSKPGDPTP